MDLAWLAARVASHFFAHISYIIGPFWGSSLQVKKKEQRFDLDAHINKSFKNLLLRDTKRIIEELSIREKATISMHQKNTNRKDTNRVVLHVLSR